MSSIFAHGLLSIRSLKSIFLFLLRKIALKLLLSVRHSASDLLATVIYAVYGLNSIARVILLFNIGGYVFFLDVLYGRRHLVELIVSEHLLLLFSASFTLGSLSYLVGIRARCT